MKWYVEDITDEVIKEAFVNLVSLFERTLLLKSKNIPPPFFYVLLFERLECPFPPEMGTFVFLFYEKMFVDYITWKVVRLNPSPAHC